MRAFNVWFFILIDTFYSINSGKLVISSDELRARVSSIVSYSKRLIKSFSLSTSEKKRIDKKGPKEPSYRIDVVDNREFPSAIVSLLSLRS